MQLLDKLHFYKKSVFIFLLFDMHEGVQSGWLRVYNFLMCII